MPGDNNVTVIWEETPTEVLGDPFYEVASDEASPLFNPNYRQFDTEGYRVWRGTDPGTLDADRTVRQGQQHVHGLHLRDGAPDEDVGTIRDVDGVPTAVVGFAGGELCDADYVTDTPSRLARSTAR